MWVWNHYVNRPCWNYFDDIRVQFISPGKVSLHWWFGFGLLHCIKWLVNETCPASNSTVVFAYCYHLTHIFYVFPSSSSGNKFSGSPRLVFFSIDEFSVETRTFCSSRHCCIATHLAEFYVLWNSDAECFRLKKVKA